MAPIRMEQLTGAALDVRRALFFSGALSDGDVPSKAGRDQLVRLGHVARHNGWNWLTEEGTECAINDGLGEAKGRWERRRRRSA